LQLSESVDSNARAVAGSNTNIAEVSRGLGSLDMQKIWKRSQLGLDYIAGGVFYEGPHFGGQGRAYQVHTFAADERILWRTGQLTVRDSFNYLPEGTFGFSSFGGAGSFGSVLGGGVSGAGAGSGVGSGLAGGTPTGNFGGGTFGSVGYQPRIGNSAIVDIVEQLSPRSSVTLGGGYDLTHFFNTSSAAFNVINSQQTSGQVGYNRLLNPKDQIGFLYAFQDLHFPTAGRGTIEAHVWNALYGHRISGRLNFVIGGGPQLVIVNNPPGSLASLIYGPNTKSVSGNGNVTFHYIVSSRTNAQFLYQRFVSPGSGFFAGATTDAARVTLAHVFGRKWTGTIDGGYSHNSSLQKAVLVSGINARSYQYWYAGTSMRRQLGPHFDAFVTYQFDDFGSGQCSAGTTNSVCGQTISKHSGAIGIDWHPRPFRLD
jgi:hypothetical protein